MPDREKVIKGLECCMSEKMCRNKCPYKGQCDDGEWYYSRAIEDALELLKVQQPRVLTMSELHNIYDSRPNHAWPYNTPPYLWAEMTHGTIPYWMPWSNVIRCLEERFYKYDPGHYGKTWRCWFARPTDEQRKAVAWE